MDTILVPEQDKNRWPVAVVVASEVVLFTLLFAYICLESLIFLVVVGTCIFAVGGAAMLALALKGRLRHAADAVALMLAVLLAFPLASVVTQRRYRASTVAVRETFAACKAWRRVYASWPLDLALLVPLHIAQTPLDGWGRPLIFRCRRGDPVATVGFVRPMGSDSYLWSWDGNVWSSSNGMLQSQPPEPPLLGYYW